MEKVTLILAGVLLFLTRKPGLSQPLRLKNKKLVGPRLIRGPYLQAATSCSIIIRWRTDLACCSRVPYGTNLDNLDLLAEDVSEVKEHLVELTGLSPHTKYYYAISGFNDQGDGDNYFFTLPEEGGTDLYRIGVFGDCGNHSVNQEQVNAEFLKYLGTNYLNAWILLGDNAYDNGTDAEFQAGFFDIYKDDLLKKFPLFPAPGNHDYHTEAGLLRTQETHEIPYYKVFCMPTCGESGGLPSKTQSFYSFDIGNIHFLSLDSFGTEGAERYRLYDTQGPQARWVERDLESSRNKTWIVAYWHHAPYTMGNHNSDWETELVQIRENFLPVLERYGVDLVLCGHSHNYERSSLMHGYYGDAASFNPDQYVLSSSSGRNDGSPDSAPYHKNSSNKGTVYVVSGSAGQVGGMQLTYPHPAMYFADAQHGGASMIEVHGNRLDFKWICGDGVIRDQFTMIKHK